MAFFTKTPRAPRQLEDGPPPARRRPSMVLSVLAILCLAALVPLGLMGYHVGKKMTEDLAAHQKEAQLDKGESVANEIGKFVEDHFGTLEVVAANFDPAYDDARARQIFEDYVGAGGSGAFQLEGVLELRLISPDPTRPVLRVNAPQFDSTSIEADLRAHVDEAVEKGRRGAQYLSNPFVPSAHMFHPLAVFSVPLRASAAGQTDDRLVLVAVVSMAAIQNIVARDGDSQSEYTAFALDDARGPNGKPAPRPFAHSQFARVIERADFTASPLVQRFAKYGESSTSLEFRSSPAEGRRHMIGTYVPVEVPGHRWGVFVQVDRELGFDQVREMRMTWVKWSVAAFVLAVVMGTVFSWRITKPIHELNESTRKVASGEYGRVVRVDSNNEIGMLADNFNLMSEEIRKTVDDLVQQKELNDQLFISSIRSLAAAIDARDPYTRGHSERVTRYARIIARQLKLTPVQVRSIEIGALLHDVGKIGIEDRILRKPASLTPEEFEIMKTHPEKGGDIMTPIGTLREATEIILHHHERWDGTGYPSGLKAEEIPLGARVVNVADTFDAMTTNRPYQRAMTYSVAARKIGEFAGKACDPSVVKAFIEAMELGLFGQVDTEARAG